MRSLGDRTVDLLVVGGGIVGAGIARDAALRGLSVALVEQNDLASGTSSRPTRLIHGGLRYLELFDFGLDASVIGLSLGVPLELGPGALYLFSIVDAYRTAKHMESTGA